MTEVEDMVARAERLALMKEKDAGIDVIIAGAVKQMMEGGASAPAVVLVDRVQREFLKTIEAMRIEGLDPDQTIDALMVCIASMVSELGTRVLPFGDLARAELYFNSCLMKIREQLAMEFKVNFESRVSAIKAPKRKQ